jgi:hypothetical protein
MKLPQQLLKNLLTNKLQQMLMLAQVLMLI